MRTRVRAGTRTREAEMLVSLSKQFRLLCSLTTFVAIEHRSPAERNEGHPALRRVPVLLAAGWGDGLEDATGQTIGRSIDFLCESVPAPASPGLLRKLFNRSPSTPSPAQMQEERNAIARRTLSAGVPKMIRTSMSGASAPRPPEPPPPDRVDFDKLLDEELSPASPATPYDRSADVRTILSLQYADGSFGWSRILNGIFQSLGLDAERWRAALEPSLPKSPRSSKSGDVVSTVAIVLLLSLHFADQEPLWQRAVRKASREFLPSSLGKTPAEVETLLGELKAKAPGRTA